MADSVSQANAGTALGTAATAGQQGFRAELDSPGGSRLATIKVSTPENLAAEIRRQEEPPARGRELGDLSTDQLQRLHRDLAVSIALAVPGLGAHVMIIRQMQIIEAELAIRQHTENNQAAES